MENLNYVFFEEFKSLDKLCGELYQASNGITHYIDDMKSISRNDYQHIPNWTTDLKQLIKLRHIRNHLAHAEGAFSEDVCIQKDIDWLREFHKRIQNQSDPIAVLYQNSKIQKQKQFPSNGQSSEWIEKLTDKEINSQMKEEIKLSFWIMLLYIIAVISVLAVIGSIIFLEWFD